MSEPNFYQRVYAIVRLIPPGRVTTYGTIAAMLGSPHASRVVGYALRAAPLDGGVPWQRVVNAQGRVSARSADLPGEPHRQHAMLEREGVVFDAEGRIDLRRFGWEGPGGDAGGEPGGEAPR